MKFLSFLVFFISLGSEANSCLPDVRKFCHGVDPGRGQLAKCLADHEDQLHPNCATEIKEFRSNTAVKNPCYEDLSQFCMGIPSEGRKLDYCLLRNEGRLSPKCANDFKMKKGNFLVKDVCAQDIVDSCYSAVSEPEGAINRCLIKKRTKLSSFCQKFIDQKITQMRKSNPCFDDTENHCPTQLTFIDIHECLEKKLPLLNIECKKSVQQESKRMDANPCYKDLKRHCRSGLSPSEQHHCLEINEKDLSPACTQLRVKENEKTKKMVEYCEQDRLRLCPDLPLKDGLVIKCLKEKKSRVSAKCKKLIQ
jgi:hypothetical protein